MPTPTPASPPTGTLTFLFTDIEGSTRMWQAAPDAMQAALARHDAILRHEIEARGGHVFKTAGDAFYAAFATPWLALEAALAAQQALRTEPWPPQAPLRVRMALHSGAAELRDGDYFGQPLNYVARLLATGHGGQTLVSAATCELCNDRLPGGVVLTSLGEHLLKDLTRRQTIYQLGHPSLPHAFAPLRTLLAPLDTRVPSIAVLPFVNRSHDEEDEYFAEGLADELINVLGKIRGLRVAARTSSFQFKGLNEDIAAIGRKLNVATVLEGSVRKAGNRLRIFVQLVKVSEGYHVWSERYDRTLEDIFAVQDDITESVVKELRATLLGEAVDTQSATEVTAQVAAAVKGRTTDPEAHRLYLQARYLLDRRTRDDNTKAIGYLKQVLERDPAFALAWAELGRAYTTEADVGWGPVAAGYVRGREAVAQALQLEPALAEGHSELGRIQMNHDWNWWGAEKSFARAVALAPRDAAMLRRAGVLASNLGRVDDAIALYRRAIELDPLNTHSYSNLGMALGANDHLIEAEQAFRKAIELAPHGAGTRAYLALNLLALSRGEEALAEASHETEEMWRLWSSAIIKHAIRDATIADAALRELLAKYAESAAYQIAEAYAARSEIDLAFEWLERAYVQRDGGLTETKTDRLFRRLHADPRWGVFLRKIGLPE